MNKQRAFLIASIAGLMAAAGSTAVQAEHDHGSAPGAEPCYGINKCKGTGDCGGKGAGCAGTNGCSGQGFINLNQDDCLRIQGGRLTAEPEPAS